jgi:hypothetical protein
MMFVHTPHLMEEFFVRINHLVDRKTILPVS